MRIESARFAPAVTRFSRRPKAQVADETTFERVLERPELPIGASVLSLFLIGQQAHLPQNVARLFHSSKPPVTVSENISTSKATGLGKRILVPQDMPREILVITDPLPKKGLQDLIVVSEK